MEYKNYLKLFLVINENGQKKKIINKTLSIHIQYFITLKYVNLFTSDTFLPVKYL